MEPDSFDVLADLIAHRDRHSRSSAHLHESSEFRTSFSRGWYPSSQTTEGSAVNPNLLRSMLLGKPPGDHDRILDFSTAVTGGLFFVPTADFLDDLTETAAALSTTGRAADLAPDDATDTTEEPVGQEGSLGIGSLRRSPRP
jgi:hypothetical protein